MILIGIACLLMGILLIYLKIFQKFPYKNYKDKSITNISYNLKGWAGIYAFILTGIIMILKETGLI
jgi:hypothetical protein